MSYISLKDQYVLPFIQNDHLHSIETAVEQAHYQLHEKKGPGSEYTGWITLPETYDVNEFKKIQTTAETIQQHSDILLVIGVGGSYLGARAAIELLTHSFQRELSQHKRSYPKVIFVGYQLSTKYINDLFDMLEDYDVSINVISKSGTTMEPAIAFRIFKNWLENRYGKESAKRRIFVTTDKHKGALKTLAKQEGYTSFVVPDDIGGRYSILTAVGLLPIAVSGISITDMMEGAKHAMNELQTPNITTNPSYRYAALRHLLYKDGKKIELLVNYEPHFHYFQEWWKQLFGESEGKDGKGLFPASASYPSDLHSLGQYIQDGERHLFQTVMFTKDDPNPLFIEADDQNLDGLNYLANRSLAEINEKAYLGALQAHKDGNVPNIVMELPTMNPYTFGYLVYFFLKSCAISSYLNHVNPFNQPGVEAYKQNMFKLLEKPSNIVK